MLFSKQLKSFCVCVPRLSVITWQAPTERNHNSSWNMWNEKEIRSTSAGLRELVVFWMGDMLNQVKGIKLTGQSCRAFWQGWFRKQTVTCCDKADCKQKTADSAVLRMIKAIDCCWMLTVFFRYAPRHTRSPLALISTMPGRPKRKAVGDTAQKAKKARGETDLKWDLKWSNAGKPDKNEIHPVIILSSSTLDGSEKIAGFDIDWTVIQTSSGRKFATGKNVRQEHTMKSPQTTNSPQYKAEIKSIADQSVFIHPLCARQVTCSVAGAKDWDWWNEAVPDKLRKLNEDGYRVMFFTNQAGIEKQKVKPREIMTKIEDIIEKLDIPILVSDLQLSHRFVWRSYRFCCAFPFTNPRRCASPQEVTVKTECTQQSPSTANTCISGLHIDRNNPLQETRLNDVGLHGGKLQQRKKGDQHQTCWSGRNSSRARGPHPLSRKHANLTSAHVWQMGQDLSRGSTSWSRAKFCNFNEYEQIWPLWHKLLIIPGVTGSRVHTTERMPLFASLSCVSETFFSAIPGNYGITRSRLLQPNLSKCLYVGDAAGRAKEWAPGKPKDFSCSDRMFAANIGIGRTERLRGHRNSSTNWIVVSDRDETFCNADFKTPEEFFLEEDPAPFQWGAVDPKEVLTNADKGDADSYHSSVRLWLMNVIALKIFVVSFRLSCRDCRLLGSTILHCPQWNRLFPVAGYRVDRHGWMPCIRKIYLQQKIPRTSQVHSSEQRYPGNRRKMLQGVHCVSTM